MALCLYNASYSNIAVIRSVSLILGTGKLKKLVSTGKLRLLATQLNYDNLPISCTGILSCYFISVHTTLPGAILQSGGCKYSLFANPVRNISKEIMYFTHCY